MGHLGRGWPAEEFWRPVGDLGDEVVEPGGSTPVGLAPIIKLLVLIFSGPSYGVSFDLRPPGHFA